MSSLNSKYFKISFLLLLHCLFLALQGCHKNDLKEEEVIRESKPAPNRLMQAILDEFAAQKIPIDLRDDEKLLVISEYQLFGTEVRQRYLAKVVRSPRGLYFKLRSMHERLDRRVNPPIWTEIEGESAAKKAYQEEQKLGLAIRDRFK